MIRNILAASVAVTALAFAAPSLAAPGGNAGANVNAGANARVNSQGPANASPTGVLNSNANSVLHTTTTPSPTTRATNSQGLQNANTRAISRANANSVLARGSVAPTALPGLTTGLTVNSSTGATLGTISQIVTDSSGNIRLVVVTSSTGQTYRLAPTTLSISGGVVTTTSM
jgi:hypothetical protein